jgi:hypothetical protein
MRNRDYQIVSDAEGPLVSRSQALAEAWGERARTINNQAWLVRFAVNEAGR